MVEVLIMKEDKIEISFEPSADDLLEIFKMAYDIGDEEAPVRPVVPVKKRKYKKRKKKIKAEEVFKKADDVFEREMKERVCIKCGKDISDRRKAAKYCKECASIVQKEQTEASHERLKKKKNA